VKYQARWKIPQLTGETVHNSPNTYSTWKEAEIDANDAAYEGVHVWVDCIVEDGEVVPATTISLAEADAFRASQWWKDKPAHVVALAQARQERQCMPFGLFVELCQQVTGEVLSDSFFTNQQNVIAALERAVRIAGG
jgi:hypothetical protein